MLKAVTYYFKWLIISCFPAFNMSIDIIDMLNL